MEKNLTYGYLVQIYGELLTERQKEIMESYYDEDLSSGEIAESLGISRQGVMDALQTACATLDRYEQVLGVYRNQLEADRLVERVREAVMRGDKEEALSVLESLKGGI